MHFSVPFTEGLEYMTKRGKKLTNLVGSDHAIGMKWTAKLHNFQDLISCLGVKSSLGPK